jgi:hypothetical protein
MAKDITEKDKVKIAIKEDAIFKRTKEIIDYQNNKNLNR